MGMLPREQVISKLMKQSTLKLPNHNFESELMDKIYEHSRRKEELNKAYRLSSLFLFLGFLSGIGINICFNTNDPLTLGLPTNDFLLGFQITFMFFALSQLDRIIEAISRLRNSN